MKSNVYLTELSDEDIDKLVNSSFEKIIQKDHLLTREKHSTKYVYFITRGIG